MAARSTKRPVTGQDGPPGVFGAEIVGDLEAACRREWLEPDGLGGFASGTICGIRTRRYHSLLLAATRPPTERRSLVAGLEEQVECRGDIFVLSSHRYKPDVVYPAGYRHIEEFRLKPWPTWDYAFTLTSGERLVVRKEILVPHGRAATVIIWTLVEGEKTLLSVRPLLAMRDYHALHHKNRDLAPAFQESSGRVSWQPYEDLPRVHLAHNGHYTHAPSWYYQFLYTVENERGLDCMEDLWSPGPVSFSLTAKTPAVVILSTDPVRGGAKAVAASLRRREAARRRKATSARDWMEALEASAEDYVVRRGKGSTIVAGYPWFTDWGRDTFISMRGLCLATGRTDEAREILLEWSGAVSQGMLPNRFPDEGEDPEFNSVDASLWFVIVCGEYLALTKYRDLGRLAPAMLAIMRGYRDGTRYGIRLDADSLIRAGEPGTQLTWMDAKFEDTCFSPRIGKPVEIQALWLNAVQTLLALAPRIARLGRRNAVLPEAELGAWKKIFKEGITSFRSRFWNAEKRCLFDVVDGPEGDDPSLRPNQLFVVSLPAPILPPRESQLVVEACERELLTPIGLRTLAPNEPGYIGTYTGGRRDRDAAYHNGTVWPWLMGPFVEAWLRIRKNNAKAKQEAWKFLEAMEAHLADAGLNHVSEVADGTVPHEPRGCPFQAWSVGEVLRLIKSVLR